VKPSDPFTKPKQVSVPGETVVDLGFTGFTGGTANARNNSNKKRHKKPAKKIARNHDQKYFLDDNVWRKYFICYCLR